LRDTILRIQAGAFREVTIDPIGETYVLKGDKARHGAATVRYALSLNGEDAFEAPELAANGFATPGSCFVAFTKIKCYSLDNPGAALFAPQFHPTAARTAPAPAAFALVGLAAITNWWLMINVTLEELFEADFIERLIIRGSLAGSQTFEARVGLPYDTQRNGTAHVAFSTELRAGLDSLELLLEVANVRPKSHASLRGWALNAVNFIQTIEHPAQMSTVHFKRRSDQEEKPKTPHDYPLRVEPVNSRDASREGARK
jgi:hypothetical protein